jgi:Flp pilus assembly protein TadD
VLAGLGRVEEARAAYLRSLELAPDRERVRAALEALDAGE